MKELKTSPAQYNHRLSLSKHSERQGCLGNRGRSHDITSHAFRMQGLLLCLHLSLSLSVCAYVCVRKKYRQTEREREIYTNHSPLFQSNQLNTCLVLASLAGSAGTERILAKRTLKVGTSSEREFQVWLMSLSIASVTVSNLLGKFSEVLKEHRT